MKGKLLGIILISTVLGQVHARLGSKDFPFIKNKRFINKAFGRKKSIYHPSSRWRGKKSKIKKLIILPRKGEKTGLKLTDEQRKAWNNIRKGISRRQIRKTVSDLRSLKKKIRKALKADRDAIKALRADLDKDPRIVALKKQIVEQKKKLLELKEKARDIAAKMADTKKMSEQLQLKTQLMAALVSRTAQQNTIAKTKQLIRSHRMALRNPMFLEKVIAKEVALAKKRRAYNSETAEIMKALNTEIQKLYEIYQQVVPKKTIAQKAQEAATELAEKMMKEAEEKKKAEEEAKRLEEEAKKAEEEAKKVAEETTQKLEEAKVEAEEAAPTATQQMMQQAAQQVQTIFSPTRRPGSRR